MYLRVQALLPYTTFSLPEIAYILFGRTAYFVTITMCLSLTMGCLILYMILSNETASYILKNLCLQPGQDESSLSGWAALITNKHFLLISYTLFLAPQLFKRHLQQMKVISYAVTITAAATILSMLLDFATDEQTEKNETTFDDLVSSKGGFNFLTGLFLITLCYSGQYAILPAYRELERPSYARIRRVS